MHYLKRDGLGLLAGMKVASLSSMNTTPFWNVVSLLSLVMMPYGLQADPGTGSNPRPGKGKDEDAPQKIVSRDEYLKKLRNSAIEQIEQGANMDRMRDYIHSKLSHRLEIEISLLRHKGRSGAKLEGKALEAKAKDLEGDFTGLEAKLLEEMSDRVKRHRAKREAEEQKAIDAKKGAVLERIEAAWKKAERLDELAESGDVETHHKLVIEWGLTEETDENGKSVSFKERLSQHRNKVEEHNATLGRRREKLLEDGQQASASTPKFQRRMDREELVAKRQKLDAEGYDEETIKIILGLPKSD
ncbi:MAG: hypothetical protein AB7F75_12530 [Planctomycetota bacterium]